ncbi:(2Fe-2S)-binding protein [Luteimonas sp. MJ246]|uniref:(2Fe-2S)-binding protein n=1 Tax=Luteimonas sp. MJ174 TaxID=3129237 RepID=UPI0031BA1CA8
MYVCVCNGVTDHQIREAAAAGCGSMTELTMRTGAGACCGSCVDTAVALLEDEAASRMVLQILPLANAA